MPDSVTIARPYARAIFEHALENKSLKRWSDYLRQLSVIVMDKNCAHFIANPSTTAGQQIDLMLSLINIDQEKDSLTNSLILLTENKRTQIIPEIFKLFEELKAEQEKELEVSVISFSPLSEEQKKQLTQALTERLQRQIILKMAIDESLLGGAIIHAGDLVIDGSVRGKLNSLRSKLAA